MSEVFGSPEARALHQAHPAIDLHADTLMWSRWTGYDLGREHRAALPRAAFMGHVDLPRMERGGVGAQFFGLVSLPISRHGQARVIDEQIDALEEQIARYPTRLRKVRTADELESAQRDGCHRGPARNRRGPRARGESRRIEHFARRGVRYLGLLHFSANEAGYPAYGRGRRDADGLTAWGKELVRRCEAARVIVDLAHINRRASGRLRSATQPPIVSHTGVARAHAHWRNIDDDQLRAVADRGGVVGLIFCPRFVGGIRSATWCDKFRMCSTSREKIRRRSAPTGTG